MNGKALCLMSLEMFAERVPLGGKLLYKDFKIRMAEAGHYTWTIVVFFLQINPQKFHTAI